MQVFYAPDICGDTHFLDESESRHIIRVLRMKAGMQVTLIDGKGNLYEGEIEDPDPRKCSIRITRFTRNFETRNYKLHIAISPLKSTERFEWFVEKSVEIGIDVITPLVCHNTEKTSVRSARLNGIIISAMKQSLKATKPHLNDPALLSDFLAAGFNGNRMIAHCNSSFERMNISDVCKPQETAIILIGPEGDFTKDEISLAYERGYRGIHLGNSRLRTETAGIAACHSVYGINYLSPLPPLPG